MKKALLMLFFLVGIFKAYANNAASDTTYDPFIELALLHSFYSDTGKLSFQCTFYMQDVDSVSANDTVIAYYQIHDEKFRILIDSVESVQDDFNNITTYHNDSVILVQNRVELTPKVTQLNLYDPTLRNDYIDSISIRDSSASLRLLRIYFKSTAPYDDYRILYDTAHKIISVNYSAKKYPYADIDIIKAFYRLKVKLQFSNYQTTGFTDDVFDTKKFAVKQNGVFTLVSPYTDFELVNSIYQ